MTVNEEVWKALEGYRGSTLSERVYHYLGSLGYTGTAIERVAKYEYRGKKGWQALVEKLTNPQ